MKDMELFRLMCNCVSHVCMTCFMVAFIRRRYSAAVTGLMAAAAAVLLVLLEYWCYSMPETPWARLAAVTLQIAVFQGTVLAISEFRDFRALFTGLIASNYALPGVFIGTLLYETIDYPVVALAVQLLISADILLVLVKTLRWFYMEVQSYPGHRWYLMCLLPSAMYLLAVCMSLSMMDTKYPGVALFTAVFFLATMHTCYLITFRLIQRMYEDRRNMHGRGILRAGIVSLKREEQDIWETERKIYTHIEQQGALLEKFRQRIHDRDEEGAALVLGELQGLTEVHQPKRFCDSAPLNGVLTYYTSESQKRGIAFTERLELPEHFRVNEWDLAVVLGNLMDNAILACEKLEDPEQRWIRMTARNVRGQLMIEIRNSCNMQVVFDEATGLPLSSRGEGHGIGMKSVAYFAEENEAVFDCGLEKDYFFARILI